MNNTYIPFPKRKRLDEENWHNWSEELPPIGHEFEYIKDGTKTPIKALRREVVEFRNGKMFYLTGNDAAIINEHGETSFGFSSSQSVRWRILGIICEPYLPLRKKCL